MPQTIRFHTHSYHTSIHELTNTPIFLTIDCSVLRCPLKSLCYMRTGLDPVTARSFWSFPSNEIRYQQALDDIVDIVNSGEREIGISVFCSAGTHRSVAMAQRLTNELRKTLGAQLRMRLNVDHCNMNGTLERHRKEMEEREMRGEGDYWEQFERLRRREGTTGEGIPPPRPYGR